MQRRNIIRKGSRTEGRVAPGKSRGLVRCVVVLAGFGLVCASWVGWVARGGPIYLEIEGIPGESSDLSHEGWIEVDGFTSVIQAEGVSRPARQPAASVPVTGEIGFRKYSDKASPKLAEAVCKGTFFPKVRFEFVTPGPEHARYYRVELEQVWMTSYSLSGGDESRPSEQLSLGFERGRWVYTEFTGSGKPLANQQLVWDFLRNEGGATRERLGFTAGAVVSPGGVLGIRWTPEPGRRYQLLRSADPAGPYLPVREIEASTSGEERWEELPAGRRLDFFLLRELE